MTVAYDSFSDAGEFTAATDPKTWTHTPTGTPRGVLVFAQNTGTTADWINGTVSYGGQALTRIPTDGWATDSAAEVASIYAYFLGTGIPTGAQTVSIDHNNSIFGTKWACCVTITGAADTEVVASGRITADTSNPSITLDSGARVAIKLFNLFSGRDAIADITNPAGITRLAAAKYASEIRSRVVGYRTTPASGSEVVNQTAGNDDVAMIGVAVAEVEGAEHNEGTFADGAVVADTATGRKRSQWVLSDGGILVDAATARKLAAGTAADPTIAADAFTGAKATGGTVTDAAVIAEAWTGRKVARGSFTDAAVASDAATGTKVAQGTVSDGAAVTESWQSAGTIAGSFADALTVSEAWTGRKVVRVAITDSATLGDAATGEKRAQGAVTEGMSLTDAWTAHKVAQGTVADGVVVGEEWVTTPPFDWDHAVGTVTVEPRAIGTASVVRTAGVVTTDAGIPGVAA